MSSPNPNPHPLTSQQLSTLAEMLTYCRPYGSGAEAMFIATYLLPLGVERDAHQNLHVTIGDSPILWSSHTDTVHHYSGRQSVRVDHVQGEIHLSKRSRKRSVCLGADDTIGVFLMREMILRGVPGHYVFHFGEEHGGIGSGDLAHESPRLVTGAQFAIALDRAGTSDVITHQMGARTASDAFALSLAAQLGDTYTPCDGGIYTDTSEYAYLIPECTNVSVGYYHAHSNREYVDYHHVGTLLYRLCALDPSQLVCARDPRVREPLHSRFTSPGTSLTSPYLWEKVFPWEKDIRVDTGRAADVWCHWCAAPIVTEDDPDRDLYVSRCECADDEYAGLSVDDAAFLRYLRER